MGLPQIAISFKNKGVSAIRRSQRGTALLFFTRESGVDFVKEYKSFSEVDSPNHTESELSALSRIFDEGVKKVISLSCVLTNGVLDIEKAENMLKKHSFNWLGVCSDKYGGADIKSFVTKQRSKGEYIKAVAACDYDFDDSAVVVLSRGSVRFTGDEREYDQYALVPSLTGALAYAALGESITYKRMRSVTSYTPEGDEGEEVDKGHIVLIRDTDGYKIARGVNSLVTIDGETGEEMKKIKIVEAMDAIKTDIRQGLEESYIGKVKNDYDSKLLLCIAVSGYFEGLGDSVLDKSYENKVSISLSRQKEYLMSHGIDTENMSDMEILKANTGSYVFLEGHIRFVDAMEDIIFTMEV